MVMALSTADATRVTQAVVAAETRTDAEIVTIVAPASDRYRDIVLHWAVLAMLVMTTLVAARPEWLAPLRMLVDGGWHAPLEAPATGLLLIVAILSFLVAQSLFGWTPLRHRLVPGATKARRVHAQAIMLFRVGVRHHTARRNGVLLYLSLAERRAEIVADHAVHAAVAPEAWGDILAALLVAVRAGRTGDGMVAAVEAIGATLAEHFPYSGGDAAELPDRLILL
jgi:putative membrane protein